MTTEQSAQLRSGKRMTARLRDLVADLRARDEELLAVRDRTRNHDRGLDHERSAREVRQTADKLDAILASAEQEQSTNRGCRVNDEITQWTGENGKLSVVAGDLVLDDGQLKLITEIHWNPLLGLRVRVGYAGENSLRSYDPAAWVAVRRYIDINED